MPRRNSPFYGSKSKSARRKAAQRRAETEEQREKRLKYGRISNAARRASESVEKREERLKNQREYMATVRAAEIQKQQRLRNLQREAYEAAKKATRNPEEEEQLQEVILNSVRLTDAETEEYHEEQLRKRRISNAARRAAESVEQREKRLKKQREYRSLQCLKKSNSSQWKNSQCQKLKPAMVSSENYTLHQLTVPLEFQPKQHETNLLQKYQFENTYIEKKQIFAAQPTLVTDPSAVVTAPPILRHVPVWALPGQKDEPKPVQQHQHQFKKMLVISKHQELVMSNLYSLWKNRKLCDAAIGNGTSTVKIHKIVLSAVCPKLLSLFSTDISSQKFLQVNFPKEVSMEALNAFAEYMYNGTLDLDIEILKQLKIIGKRLDMKEFEELCDMYLPKDFPQFTKLPLIQITMPTPTPNLLSSPVSISMDEFESHLPNHMYQPSAAAASSSFTHIPLIQNSMPIPAMTSSLVSPITTSIQSVPSITTQVIDVKQEITDAELAQVQKDTTVVFGQESAVASLAPNKSGNAAGFVICPSIKTEPVGPDDNRYGRLSSSSNQVFTQSTSSSSLAAAAASTSISSVPASSTKFPIPCSQSTDVKSTRLKASPSYETPLVSDLSPVSHIGETVCSQSSAMNEDSSKQLNRQSISTSSTELPSTSTNNAGIYPVGPFTTSVDNQSFIRSTNVGAGSPHSQATAMKGLSSKPLSRQSISTSFIELPSTNNEGVYPVGLFTAKADNLPLLTTETADAKTIDFYKTDLS